jgi:dienelactone hydrolase
MKEHDHQKLLIEWAKKNYPNTVIFAIPNGGVRDAITAKRLKDEGVLAGVPDLFVANGNPGLFIEMKEPGKGVLSKAQKDTIPKLQSAGYPVSVCYGYEDAKKVLSEYLKG